MELFGDAIAIGYESFESLVASVDSCDVDYALLPCENSIHGSIARAYDLLLQHPRIAIVDETTFRIEQALIGVPGSNLAGVRRIASHPVALEQCRRFLASLPNVRVASDADTAGAVRRAIESADSAAAAIGPVSAARRYGGIVLAENVQDDRHNVTPFFSIARGQPPRRTLRRACVAFPLEHRPGALHAALGIFAERRVNLRSLLARPMGGAPFHYMFYAEADGIDAEEVAAVASVLATDSRVLGAY